MIGFVAGAAVGYVLGTRAGRARYDQIKRGAHRLWTSDPVQERLDQAGQAVKTQALPFVADKVGDAVKAAGRAVKDKASNKPLEARTHVTERGTVIVEVTDAAPPHALGAQET
ncbi:MAG: hypothetical protein KBF43_08100 [Dermatophilaceae bacterium]|jgi:hypothetical protein|nr:hypothetical protein [Actinomycetales bacterium]MBP8881532.1 hypothetical protein [Dermatophilaceae bacterium]MBP9918538.1 hypothetical protein [Dermatophilaceae bacterium]